MSGVLRVLLVLLTLASIHSYVKINTLDKLAAIHEQYYEFPIIQIYHNDKFPKSSLFRDIQAVFKEAEINFKDYSRFLMFNCQRIKYGENYVCDDLNDRREIRKVVGFFPNSTFMHYRGKLLENPSRSLQYLHSNDDFYVVEFEKLLEQIMPNFFQEIKNLQSYQGLLQARHYPKLVFLTRQGQIPMVIRQIGAHFFLKFDLKFISEQSQSVITKMGIKNLPKLVVVKYNYAKKDYEIFQYPKIDFSTANFQNIKAYLQPFALVQRRTDLLMYELKQYKERKIIVVYNSVDALKFLERAESQVIVSQGNIPAKLSALKQKYGKYYEYLHLQNDNADEKLELYHPVLKKKMEMPNGELKFDTLTHRKFVEGTAVWMNFDFVVIRVREKHGHICALENLSILRGLTRCLILNEAYYEHTSQLTGIDFDIGLTTYISSNNSGEIIGRSFKNAQFEETYSVVESTTRLKTLEIVNDFKKQPFRSLKDSGKLREIAAITQKKSAFLFSYGKPNELVIADLLDTTLRYFNDYEFYHIDITCNKEIFDEIFGAKNSQVGLMIFHAKNQSYVVLKAKLSKQSLDKFLDINLRDNKRLPFHTLSNQDAMLRRCNIEKNPQTENYSL